jgi:hypothetical protein
MLVVFSVIFLSIDNMCSHTIYKISTKLLSVGIFVFNLLFASLTFYHMLCVIYIMCFRCDMCLSAVVLLNFGFLECGCFAHRIFSISCSLICACKINFNRRNTSFLISLEKICILRCILPLFIIDVRISNKTLIICCSYTVYEW